MSDKPSDGEQLFNAINRVCLFILPPEFGMYMSQERERWERAAATFAAPYLARISELEKRVDWLGGHDHYDSVMARLESENNALRKIVERVLAIDAALPAAPTERQFMQAYMSVCGQYPELRKLVKR